MIKAFSGVPPPDLLPGTAQRVFREAGYYQKLPVRQAKLYRKRSSAGLFLLSGTPLEGTSTINRLRLPCKLLSNPLQGNQMEILLIIFILQGLLGAFDTIYHHELTERLPWRPGAAKELKLHGIRNFFYSIIFISIGWIAWQGIFAWMFFAILMIEIVITLMDFVEEDKSRKLPASERITHTILALNYGIILALLLPILWQWSQAPSGFSPMNFGVLSWIMTAYAAGVFVWACRDLSRGLAFSEQTIKPQLTLEQLNKPSQNILVTGGTGFIGKIFCQAMIDQGHHITLLTRNLEKAASLFHGKITLIDSLDLIRNEDRFDIIVNLAGETISQRWSDKTKTKIINSRLQTTHNLIALIQRLQDKPRVFISGSAIWHQ
jgi:hypothetical protein